jgi:hypothetical protein
MNANQRPFLWLPDADTPVVPLTDEMIRETEAQLGVKLPESYLEIMQEHNGGVLRFNIHPAPANYDEKCIYVHPLDSIDPTNPFCFILGSEYLCIEWEMPLGLVLLAGNGHTWVALDYRNWEPDEEPPVVYVNNISENEVYPLAPDFATFLDGLLDDNLNYVVGFVSVGENFEALRIKLNELLAIDLEYPRYGVDWLLFEYKHPQWSSLMRSHNATLRFQQNTKFDYPWYPQCDWLFMYDVADEQLADEIYDKLEEIMEYEIIKVHSPECREDYV